MKTLIVPKLEITGDINTVSRRLQDLPDNELNTVNWPGLYPYVPDVCFRLAHDGENMYLQFQVREQEILAAIENDNERVCTDSCVEMFISFDNDHYYNAEFSCIGKALLGYRKTGEPAVRGTSAVMQSIKRLPTLGAGNRMHEQGDISWMLTLIIPLSAFWNEKIKSFSGLTAKANFYKCGDNLTVPHYLSWSEINTPKPSFHQPRYFGTLKFE